MKVSLHRDVLLPLLQNAAHALPSVGSGPMNNYVLEVQGDQLIVAASNIAVTVIGRTPHVTIADADGRVLLPPSLMSSVASLPDGDVSIHSSPTTAVITSGQTKSVLMLQDPSTYPVLPDPATLTEWAQAPVLPFLDTLRTVQSGADVLPVQPGFGILAVRGSHAMTASGTRMYRATFPEGLTLPDLDIPVGLSRTLATILVKSEAEFFSVSQGQNAVVFRAGNYVLVLARLTAAFPDVEKSFLKPALSNDMVLTVDRDELLMAIKRVRMTVDESTGAVLLKLTGDGIALSSKMSDGSYTEGFVSAVWTSDAITVAVNLTHLSNALSAYPLATCDIRFAPKSINGLAPVLLTCHEDGNNTDIVISQLRKELL